MAISGSADFVRWFRSAAPYMHAFRGRTFVIAFGGEVVDDSAKFVALIHDLNLLASVGVRLVLVHGARPQIEARLQQLSHRTQYSQRTAGHRRYRLVVRERGQRAHARGDRGAVVDGIAEFADGGRRYPCGER